ncbi:triacylglycerol lipase [Pseudomonas fulva]|nr:triacylglycerol lipase [Pseudomonas fulva]MBF8778990.1 triacylglycerol lipase [Pseudomonas fulva]
MSQELATRYPLVLVPGMFGFVRLVFYPYWYGIPAALRQGGAQVFPVQVSPLHGTQVRGEQLLAIIEDICQRTGAAKVNLLGHSQGALDARHAAARRPDRVASVTSIAGPNQGSELADWLERKAPDGSPQGRLLKVLLEGIAALLVWLETDWRRHPLPIDAQAAHQALTSAGVASFNQACPQGLPLAWGAEGPGLVDGVRYYCWSGTLQPGLTDQGRNRLDGSHRFCRLCARSFVRERGQCDGMVGRYSSHLGQVIGDDYPLDHLDIVNQSLGAVGKGVDPVRLFIEHAARLKAAGL